MEIEVRENGGLSVSVGPAMRGTTVRVRELAAGDVRRGPVWLRVRPPGGLGVPAEAVREWQQTYRATGRDGPADHGREAARDATIETKVAAARAVVDGGMSQARGDGALRHRERDAAEAVVQAVPRGRRARRSGRRPKGRPRGSGAKAAPTTREQELEREVRKLEAQVAYLKKSIALKAERRSRTGRRP